MSYVEKVLMPDEQIIYSAALHWIIYLQGLSITIAGGLAGFYSYPALAFLFGPNIAQEFARAVTGATLLVVLAGVMLLIGAYIRQTATELVVTNRRLIAKYGFISRVTYEIMLSRITGANFDQTVTGRLLGFGTIWVHGAGGDVSPIAGVANPQLFYRALMSALEHAQAGGR
jgi:uncharacterized membrane protein YdbT with pleckstrin-like domain